MTDQTPIDTPVQPLDPWSDPTWTADGSRRAAVALAPDGVETLWFNTGTLCNIACATCYIESSPTNDRLVYLTADEVTRYLDEIATLGWRTREIAFTGGEPFLNPDILEMLAAALERGFETLVLTNAMRPMRRPRIADGLKALQTEHGARLTLRVSLDHFSIGPHDAERGEGAFESAMEGLRWLAEAGIRTHVAGRLRFAESEAEARAGFAALYAREGLAIDPQSPVETLLLPEMDPQDAPPEITEACWGILGKAPDDVMCANTRMVVKRKGAERPTTLACTLIPYDAAFELGETLAESARPVALKHPYCATFCVLGGARCSA